MADLGFLQGLAGGLQGGLQGYESAVAKKRQEKQDEIEGLVKQAGLLESGYKIADDPLTGRAGLVPTEEGGGLKTQFMRGQVQEQIQRQKDRPLELEARKLALDKAEQEVQDKKEAKTTKGILRGQAAREQDRSATIFNSVNDIDDAITAISSGQPISDPLGGTTKAGLALKSLAANLKASRKGEDGSPGLLSDSELPDPTFDSMEVMAEKLKKIRDDKKLELENLGLSEDPRLKGKFDRPIDFSRAAITPGQAIRHPLGLLQKLSGANQSSGTAVKPSMGAQIEAPRVGDTAVKGGVTYERTAAGWVPKGK